MQPDKPVLYRWSTPKFPSLPMLSGITPVMEVLSRLRTCRPARLPIEEGILPDIPVSSKRRTCSVVGRFPISLGTCPVKPALLSRVNCWSWLQFDSEAMNSHPASSSACSLLLYRYRPCRAWSLPSVGGTYPVSLFEESKINCRLVRLENEAGMGPVNWFLEKSRILMPGNLLPKSAGIPPWNMFP
uniref:Uncharacterized protein n=1 Tax=Setaria viridis TaxID=4556 RepID=A0A4U6UI87_SETVI|nr:hypothetical protein SEVIR_5G104001v2 [Setaria viridis]